MTKADILSEIRRVAAENMGSLPGMRTFERMTGVRHADWFGIHWRSWSDAVREAGLAPNEMTSRINDEEILHQYCELTRELGRFPTKGDFKLKRAMNPGFPSVEAFVRRYGSYPALRAAAYTYSLAHSDASDVTALLAAAARRARQTPDRTAAAPTGFVYLLKHGSRAEYKIGKTNNPLRREGEIRLQLPERLNPVHYIETDDPAGVEAYWHARFADKRKEGEWFALNRDDVAAFKRWKRIV